MSQRTNLATSFIQLREALAKTLLSAQLAGDVFDLLIRAATAKSLDFNIRVHSAPDEDGVLYQPFLRGLCEDLIYLRYFDSIGSNDREELLKCLQARDVFRAVDKQQIFFEAKRPMQPIYLAELHSISAASESAEAKKQLASVWKRLGWPKQPPTVQQLADKGHLLELYEYLYAATSRTVHFTPHSLLRLGWCKMAGTDPEALDGNEEYTFSLSHFAGYHSEFTRFYGAFLFLLFYDLFENRFPHDEAVSSAVSVIRNAIDQVPRWPEIVTFEEMNVRVDDGIHFYEFTKCPLGITLMKGLPKHLRQRLEKEKN